MSSHFNDRQVVRNILITILEKFVWHRLNNFSLDITIQLNKLYQWLTLEFDARGSIILHKYLIWHLTK